MFRANRKNGQKGAVSLFVVIFFALMVTVVTVGFIVLMVRNQRIATNTDLSQSAYDSALAGAEDGKRIIAKYMEVCSDPASLDCTNWKNAIAGQTCLNLPNKLLSENHESEIEIASGAELEQAYTCLKIKMNTPDYLGQLDQGSSEMIPLLGADEFESVEVKWFLPKDLTSGSLDVVLPNKNISDKKKIMDKKSNWTGKPPVLKVQLIQYSTDGFEITDFDNNTHNSSLYLYPNKNGLNDFNFSDDERGDVDNAENILKFVKCYEDFVSDGYACSAKVSLPDMNNRKAYLYLTPFYASTNFKVTLFNNTGGTVDFSEVQPEIDSTGRANDLFRRVKVRANLFHTKGLTGIKAVEVLKDPTATDTGSFIKNFTIEP